jgi:hypothetical protein
MKTLDVHCKVCRELVEEASIVVVRSRFDVPIYQCSSCGFTFFHEVPWLEEAYADAINATDTGYIARNLSCRDRMRYIIELCLNPEGRFLDFGAGYGMFVRLMRDAGYDFYWSDLYCDNLFAIGFEDPLESSSFKYEAITAFEVMEHVADPIATLEQLFSKSDTVVFSTELMLEPLTARRDWWYFGFDHGQHISSILTRACSPSPNGSAASYFPTVPRSTSYLEEE